MDVASPYRRLRRTLSTALGAVVVAGLTLGVSTDPSAAAQVATPAGWHVVWSDAFTGAPGSAPSSGNWLVDLGHSYPGGAADWGTGEVEEYTADPANLALDGNGHLAITATRTAAGGWRSARIETRRADFAPPAGGSVRFEARLRLPDGGPGYWPAFWALGSPFRPSHTAWPGAGEVDIMENIDNQPSVHGTLHCGLVETGGPCHEDTGLTGAYQLGTAAGSAGYHTYSVVWSSRPQRLQWFVDDRLYWTVTPAMTGASTWSSTFGHGYFLLLDLAIGGGWPGNPTEATGTGATMRVDYVSVATRTFVMARNSRRQPTRSGPPDSSGVLDAILGTVRGQGILVTDAEHVILLANPGAHQLFGYPAGDLAGRRLDTVVELSGGGGPARLFDTAPSIDEPSEGSTHTLLLGDGGRQPAALCAGAIRDRLGRFTGGVVVVWRPDDEQRVAGALRELERLRADFAATVSHELRTPLASVVGYTEMLLDGDAGELSGPQHRLLDAVDRNARRLQALVADLLVICRVEAQPLRENARPVVLQAVLERSVRGLSGPDASRDVRLHLHQPARSLLVDGDAEELTQLVGNVVGNAVKFTPAGGTVQVHLGVSGGYARLRVTDTGVGIRPDELDRVFDAFFRTEQSRVEERPGAGLGLTVARSIVERHHGTITIGTTETGGTMVEIQLPRATRSASDEPLAARSEAGRAA